MNGWIAECQTCPTSLNEQYGHQEKVHQVFDERTDAEHWALIHSESNDCYVTVHQYMCINFRIESMDAEMLRAIFGEGAE